MIKKFGLSLETIRPVLVVVDVQQAFSTQPTTSNCLQKIEGFLEEWESVNLPMAFSLYQLRENCPLHLLRKFSLERSEIPFVHQSIHHFSTKPNSFVFTKDTYSIWGSEHFTELAKINQWNVFLICGFSSHACVLKSVLDTFDNGKQVFVLRDLCASHKDNSESSSPSLHTNSMDILSLLIGSNRVINSSEIISDISSWPISVLTNAGSRADIGLTSDHAEISGDVEIVPALVSEPCPLAPLAHGIFCLTKAATKQGGDRYQGELEVMGQQGKEALSIYVPQSLSRSLSSSSSAIAPASQMHFGVYGDFTRGTIPCSLSKLAEKSGGDCYEGKQGDFDGGVFTLYLPQQISRVEGKARARVHVWFGLEADELFVSSALSGERVGGGGGEGGGIDSSKLFGAKLEKRSPECVDLTGGTVQTAVAGAEEEGAGFSGVPRDHAKRARKA